MRLDKFLTKCYLGSRKEVKTLITQKRIKVNQNIIVKSDYEVDETQDLITLDNQPLKYLKHHYYLLNKPQGYLCATFDHNQKTIMELFNSLPESLVKNLFPVGRLDKDTEGLLLVTDDGALAHQITSPNYHIEKTYYVEYEGSLVENAALLLEKGLKSQDETFRPAKIKYLDQHHCYLIISEGKYHQVKKMIHLLGGVVTYLKRVQIGKLTLPASLNVGCFIELTKQEIDDMLN